MSQHDFILDNATGAAFRTDLNSALAAGVSLSSGTSAPATTYAYQFWADTTTGILKLRNAANDAWITVGPLSNIWLSPTLVTPALGTPTSGDLTACTSNTESASNNSTQLATTAYADRLTAGTLAGAFTALSASSTVTITSTTNNGHYDASNAGAASYLFRGAVNVGGGGDLNTSDFHVHSTATDTQLGTENTKNLRVVVSSTTKAEFSSTGLAVTGSITASTGFGCNSKTAQTAVTVNAASTDLATVVALCNQLRAALVANGICV